MNFKSSVIRRDTDSLQSADTLDKFPKNRLTFLSQIIIVYAIIITSLVQICLQSPDKELWLILLSSSVGYILPSPGLKFRKRSGLSFEESAKQSPP